MRLHVCSWNGVVGTVDVDLRWLEVYFVRMKVGESSKIWGVGGVSVGIVLNLPISQANSLWRVILVDWTKRREMILSLIHISEPTRPY